MRDFLGGHLELNVQLGLLQKFPLPRVPMTDRIFELIDRSTLTPSLVRNTEATIVEIVCCRLATGQLVRHQTKSPANPLLA